MIRNNTIFCIKQKLHEHVAPHYVIACSLLALTNSLVHLMTALERQQAKG